MTRRITIDNTFPAEYELEVLDESPQPARLRHLYYPGATERGGRDGLLLHVTPRVGPPWLGTFARGDSGFTGVCTTPDPAVFCVSVRGAAYLVSAVEQNSWSAVETVQPVRDLHVVQDCQIIVFSDYTRLVAYGPHGVQWESARLAWDDLQVVGVRGPKLRCRGFNAPGNRYDTFEVDLMTGAADRTALGG